ESRLLGPFAPGTEPVRVVPHGRWQAARSTGPYTLVACTVGPGFDFAAFELLRDRPVDAARVRELGGDVAALVERGGEPARGVCRSGACAVTRTLPGKAVDRGASAAPTGGGRGCRAGRAVLPCRGRRGRRPAVFPAVRRCAAARSGVRAAPWRRGTRAARRLPRREWTASPASAGRRLPRARRSARGCRRCGCPGARAPARPARPAAARRAGAGRRRCTAARAPAR